jgi:hypothetical protein
VVALKWSHIRTCEYQYGAPMTSGSQALPRGGESWKLVLVLVELNHSKAELWAFETYPWPKDYSSMGNGGVCSKKSATPS